MAEIPDCINLGCLSVDDNLEASEGVLLSHDIEYYATNHKMIIPFKRENLRPAGIRLSLGKQFAIGGELKELFNEPDRDHLIIPPFQVAIITTEETINLPRFIIARWNLIVSLVYEGLLWTGALQVDPGWCGPLPCPIYNLSNEPVTLTLGEPIVLMDFVKTTQFIEGKSKEYKRPPKKKSLSDYNYKLKSALFTKAAERVNELEKRIDTDFEKRINRVESLTVLTIASIAILFTALSIFVTSGNVKSSQSESLHPWFIAWPAISIGLSIVALCVSIIKWDLEKKWLKFLLISFFILFCTLFVFLSYPFIKKILMFILT